MTRVAKDGISWTVQTDFLPLLDSVLKGAQRVVKRSPAKLVIETEFNGSKFYVKRYLACSIFRSTKYSLKTSPARREWQLSRRLAKLQIPVVQHLAFGERWGLTGLRESILITKGFEGQRLADCPNVDREKILDFVKNMHRHGVIQNDLHAGNLLVSPVTGEVRLVDLGHTQIKRIVTPAERQANLALLRISAPIPVSADIERLSQRLRRKAYASRCKRCLKHNREFQPIHYGPLKWQVRTPFLNQSLKVLLQDPDGFLEGRAQIIKSSRSTTVGAAHGLFLKRFNLAKWANLFKDFFRRSRARKTFRLAYHLELFKIPTPRAVAFAERRVAGLLLRSYCVFERAPAVVSLAAGLERAPIRQIVRHTAELIARLHNEGFSHRDLKADNLLVDPQGHVSLVDLDGLRHVRRISDSRAAKDLTRLAASSFDYSCIQPAHRVAFLLRYCKERSRTRVPRRRWRRRRRERGDRPGCQPRPCRRRPS